MSIEVKNLVKHYGPLAVCNHLNLTIPSGELVALLGPSGSGKTTLVNLLPRFVRAHSGDVLLDGVPLAQWQLAALRRQFAMVSQDVVMLNDTLAANVALGADMDPTRVQHALEQANLGDLVAKLPQARLIGPWPHHASPTLTTAPARPDKKRPQAKASKRISRSRSLSVS